MAFVYVHGRERISSRRPVGFKVCDRCGTQYSRTDLTWQFEWQGWMLQNQQLLVCPSCLDDPQPQLRAYVVPPDPVPFQNARVELDAGWPMETGPVYDSAHKLVRDTSGIVLTTSGGTT